MGIVFAYIPGHGAVGIGVGEVGIMLRPTISVLLTIDSDRLMLWLLVQDPSLNGWDLSLS